MKPLIDVSALAKLANESQPARSMKVDVRNADDGSAELLIVDFIGEPETTSSTRGVIEFLNANPGRPVHARINSGGGLAFDGISIYNALAAHDAPVTTTNEGMAASAAAIILMAGSPIRMMDNATLFIHRAMGIVIGNATVMRDEANFLEKLDRQIAGVFVAQTGKRMDAVMKLMTGEVDGTSFNADEASQAGFVNEIVTAKKKSKPQTATRGVPISAIDRRLREIELDSQAAACVALSS